jgi:hypothetical protein
LAADAPAHTATKAAEQQTMAVNVIDMGVCHPSAPVRTAAPAAASTASRLLERRSGSSTLAHERRTNATHIDMAPQATTASA